MKEIINSKNILLSIIFYLMCLISNAMPIINEPIARTSTQISIDSIKNLYEPLMQSEKYDDLVSKQRNVLELSLKIYGPNSSEIAKEYHWLAYFLSLDKKYSDAILCVQTSANIYDSLGKDYIGEYFGVLEKIALYHFYNQEEDKALRAYCFILDEFYNKNVILIETYVEALRMSLFLSRQYQLPVSLDRPLELLSDEYINDDDRFNLYPDVVNYYVDKGLSFKAIEVYKSAERITTMKPKYLNYEKWGDILLNVVNAYVDIGDCQQAINILGKAEEVYKSIGNPFNDYYVYYSLGSIRHRLCQWQEAYEAYDQAIKVVERIGGMNLAKANLLASQARCMLVLNERDKASRLIDEAINLIEVSQKTASLEIIEIYDVFSKIAFQKGCYGEVIDRLNKVKTTYVTNDFFSNQIDLNLGLAYAKIGEFDNAILIAERLLLSLPDDNFFRTITNTEFESYLGFVTSLATIYSLSDRLSDAIHLLTHAYEICELNSFNSGEGYGVLLNNLGLYNSYLGNYEDAKNFFLLSLGFIRSNVYLDQIKLFETLSNLFLLSLQSRDEENLHYYAILSFETMQNIDSVYFVKVENYLRNLLHYFVIVEDLERAESISSYIQSESSRLYGKGSMRYYQAISSSIYIYMKRKKIGIP